MSYKRIIALIIIVCSAILAFTNPTAKQFEQYVRAHAKYNKHNTIQATRDEDFLLWSIFFTQGKNDVKGKYIGILGGFYFWDGFAIENIDYSHHYDED